MKRKIYNEFHELQLLLFHLTAIPQKSQRWEEYRTFMQITNRGNGENIYCSARYSQSTGIKDKIKWNGS